MSLKNKIKDKLGEHDPEDVIKAIKIKNNILISIYKLILDKIFTVKKLTKEHKASLEKYTSLFYLTLNEIGLESLENFPFLKAVEVVSILCSYYVVLD